MPVAILFLHLVFTLPLFFQEAVIKSERIRRLERLKAHYQNDTWTKREAPPADWAAPLPEWMVKRDENTYLAYKAKEMREGKEEESEKSSCTIM